MTTYAAAIACAAIALLGGDPASAQQIEGDQLARRGQIGVWPVPVTTATASDLGMDAPRGVLVQQVVPDAGAARAGLQAGDVVLSMNGEPVGTPQDLVALAAPLRAGDAFAMSVWRAGRALDLSGTATARPVETYAAARVVYGEVAFEGGHLRSILVRPNGVAQPPVVYLLPGYPCQSVEAVGSQPNAYRFIVGGLLGRGYAVYRVEKPGVGDSFGTPECQTTDFEVEVAAAAAGYRSLLAESRVDPENVFIYGHSMGGTIAPRIARDVRMPRGIAVYGVVVRNWQDYLLDVHRRQPLWLSGADPGQAVALAEQFRPYIHRVFHEKRDPASVISAASDPAVAQQALLFQGDGQMLNRHYTYWHRLAEQNVPALWRDARTHVLAVYGEADFAAIHDDDHRHLVEIVNHERPGTATFEMLPQTNHGLLLVGSREEHMQHRIRGTLQSLQGQFNERHPSLLADWMDEVRQMDVVASTTALPTASPTRRVDAASPGPGGVEPWADVSDRLPRPALSGRIMDMEYADLDQDGDIDFVVANEFAPNLVLTNDGTGVFSVDENPIPPKANDTEDIAIADFDGNGTLDLVFVSEDNQVHEYYLNDGALGLTDVSDRLAPFRTTSNAVLALDVDGDGDMDLVLGNAGQNRVLLNDGDGHFADATEDYLPSRVDVTQDIEAGDVNGDGRVDLLFGNEDRNRLLLAQPDGSFADADEGALPLRGTPEETREADLGDVDGDGDLDVVFANVGFLQPPHLANRLLLNDGAGRFTDASAERLAGPPGHTLDADFADIDGDGDLDLLLGNGFGAGLVVLANDGAGTFREVTSAFAPPGLAADIVDVEVVDLGPAGGRVLYLTHFQGEDLLLAEPGS
ncbi:MAG: alpha/beta fold hydrolase [Bacteroidota bacterium]